jgi:hypothetical protein
MVSIYIWLASYGLRGVLSRLALPVEHHVFREEELSGEEMAGGSLAPGFV